MDYFIFAATILIAVYIIFVSATDAETRQLEAKSKALNAIAQFIEQCDKHGINEDFKKGIVDDFLGGKAEK